MQGLGRLPLHFGDVDAFLSHLIKRRKLAQFGDDLDHFVDHVVDFLLRVESAESEADRGVRQVFSDAQRLEHVAGFQSGRSAGRAARYRDVIYAHQERFAFDISEAHIQVVREAVLNRAVDVDLIELGFQTLFQAVAQSAEPRTLCLHFLLTEFTGFAQADDARHVERPGTHAALVAAAIDDGRELHARVAAANIQRANALGTVNFVAADGQQVDIVFLHVHRDFADGLHAVNGKENAVFLGDFADFGDGIDHANLIVGVHYGDQDGGRPNGSFQIIQADAAIALHRQIGNLEPVFFQALARIKNRFVLDGLSDDVVALFAEHFRDTLDHQIVRFGRAACKDDLFRGGATES